LPTQSSVPKSLDYPVSEVYVGKTAPLILKRDDWRGSPVEASSPRVMRSVFSRPSESFHRTSKWADICTEPVAIAKWRNWDSPHGTMRFA